GHLALALQPASRRRRRGRACRRSNDHPVPAGEREVRDLTAKRFRLPLLAGIAAIGLAVAGSSLAQQSRASDKKKEESAPTIDAATGKALNAAIEFLNMEKYAEAQAAIGELKLDKLSPYERSKVEQILFNISYSQDKYAEARGHLQKAIEAGGLNEQEVS